MADSVESEVKLVCRDVAALIARNPEMGWEVLEPRHFEDNVVFELPEDALANRGSILRLRVADGVATLTFKGLVPESATSEIKVREELETGVERPETLATIFERLGMRRSFRYQKYRTVFRLAVSGARLVAMFDETPFGNFLEIEGDEARVVEAATALGYGRADFVNASYIGMQAALCRARGVPLQDLVFEEAGGSVRARSVTASADGGRGISKHGPPATGHDSR
jgi:adenylate cyclase class 2